jgi:hypothetical protein
MGRVLQQLDELPQKVNGLYSTNPQEQYEATQWFRKLLSIGRSRFMHLALSLRAL